MLDTKITASKLKTRAQYVEKLKEMGIESMRDLLLYFPRAYLDEQNMLSINELSTAEVGVTHVTIKSLFNTRTKTGKIMTRGVVADHTGEMPVMWFNQGSIKQRFPKGSKVILTGKAKWQQGRLLMMSPKIERPSANPIHTARLVPVYPETEGISSRWLRQKIHERLALADYFKEPLPKVILEKENFMSFSSAIKEVHFPSSNEKLNAAKNRLAFQELFFLQYRALLKKEEWKKKHKKKGKNIKVNFEDLISTLPFKLTGAQEKVLGEIKADLKKGEPMRRLVQGDVGAGKTVLAAAAIYGAYQTGKQSALMAPTEILAKQHASKLTKLLSPLGLNIKFLLGSMGEKEKKESKLGLSSGTADLVIGTHAIIQEDVNFQRLGLAVVDEQHRFGVKQREQFLKHGAVNTLSLTATPIPRTLALTLYGDQDLSILDELPPGRKEIVTRIVPEHKREDAYKWIDVQVEQGRQIFVVCPLIEDSESIEVKSATAEFERLSKEVFVNHKCELLHGKMKSEEKDAVMNQFAKGEINILISTSVIEVGIDVPNASIMIIEGADRFGLAQLHQFRGRVGRGEHQSYCFLFSDSNSDEARLRLSHMQNHSSGFDLAELDLAMRGPGEVYGIKQSGLPDLKMANLADIEMVEKARQWAENMLKT